MNLHDRQILLVAPEIINLRSMPCVGLGYIGAYLAREGLDVRIVDAQYTKEDPLPVLRQAAPTLVGIGVDSRTIERGLRIAREARRCGHTTLLGGLHVSLVKEAILDHPEVDYGIVGDGEIAAYQLVEALEGRRRLEDVSGLIYRGEGGERRRNPNTTEEVDLDSLPFPDYRLAGVESVPLYPLVTSRDCPYRCTYCTVGNISHGRFRARSPESCIDEICAAKERYGTRGFLIVDENFSVRIDRARALCELLIEREVNLPWTAFEGIRADCLDDDFLDLLKRAGCRWLFFGIESAENAVLKRVQKGSKLAHVERAVARARARGFKVGGFLIVGLPDSSFEADMRSIDWAVRHLDKAQFWMSIPYYGTKLHEWVKANARLLRPPVGDNLVNTLSTMPFYDTPAYPAHEIKRAHAIASLRTGIDFFFEYLDREASLRLGLTGAKREAYERRLLEFVCRWDPSWLPRVEPGRGLPGVPDPIEEALAAAARGADEPLPGDMIGRRSTPVSEPARGRRLPVLDG